MDSREIIGFQLKVFKISGIWPEKKFSFLYFTYSIVIGIFLYYFHVLFKLSSLLFINSIGEFTDISLLASAVAVITTKCVVLQIKRPIFNKLLDLIHEMDKKIHISEQQKFLAPLLKKTVLVNKISNICVYSSWFTLMIQIIIQTPQERVYKSTSLFPIEALQRHSIYIAGLFYEAIANFTLVPVFVAINFFAYYLICILVCHIQILCERFRSFGENGKLTSQKQELVNIFKMYDNISR